MDPINGAGSDSTVEESSEKGVSAEIGESPVKFSFLYFEDHLKVGSCCALPHNKLKIADFEDVSRWLWERHRCIVITNEQAEQVGLRWMGEDS